MALAVVLCLLAIFQACSGAQRPSVEQAKAALQLACDGLALAFSDGQHDQARELAAEACDVERTTAIMRQIVTRAELVAAPPDWLGPDLSPTPAGDGGRP